MFRSSTVGSCYNLLTFGYAEPLSSFFDVIFPSRSLSSAKISWTIIRLKFSVLSILPTRKEESPECFPEGNTSK